MKNDQSNDHNSDDEGLDVSEYLDFPHAGESDFEDEFSGTYNAKYRFWSPEPKPRTLAYRCWRCKQPMQTVNEDG
jgi:hypothetical protein